MKKENIKSMIALQRINNKLLGILDSVKNKKDIKLKQVLDQLYEPYENIETDYRDTHSFFNQYQFISSLYTYVVLPKESFFDSIPNNIKTNSLKDEWGINKLTPAYKLKYFIRRIRNSVAHGNIEFSKKLEFTFKDVNPKDKNDIFLVKLTDNELMNFTKALGYFCITTEKIRDGVIMGYFFFNKT